MKERIYMDNAASTRPYIDIVEKFWSNFWSVSGNPSSAHTDGREARKIIETARKEVAEAICARPEEIYFTSGGTESNNWAIKGAAFSGFGRKIIVSEVEHPSIIESCRWLESIGYKIEVIPVNQDGIVDLEKLNNAVTPDTIIVSVQMANNEIGTIQPIREISKITRKNKVLFHTDAVQAAGAIPIDVNYLGVDLLSMSAHKFHGVKGTGAMYIRNVVKFESLIHGGGQEKGRRSGTENVPGIYAMGKAITESVKNIPYETFRLNQKKELLKSLLTEKGIRYKVNGTGDPEKRLPNNLNLSFPDADGKKIVGSLDYYGVSCSSGSACHANSNAPSRVLTAIGCTEAEMNTSVRLTFGIDTTDKDIKEVADAIAKVVNRE